MFDCGCKGRNDQDDQSSECDMFIYLFICLMFVLIVLFFLPVMMLECVNVVYVVSSFMCEPTIDGRIFFFFNQVRFIYST